MWASYQMPSSPYCMIYLWWKAKEKIMADHSWEWKSIRKLVDVIFYHKFRKTYQTGRKQVNARLKLRFWAESIVHKSTHASCKSRLSWLVWPSDQRLWRYVIMSFFVPSTGSPASSPFTHCLRSEPWTVTVPYVAPRPRRDWAKPAAQPRGEETVWAVKATAESKNVTFVCSHCS